MEFVISFLLAALVTWLIVFVPPYEKWVYEKTPAVSQEEIISSHRGTDGYKAGKGIPEAKTYDEMSTEEGWIHFTMKVNSNQLVATGIYKRVEPEVNSEYETNKKKIAFLRNRYIYGQFYILTLKDGKKIAILLNDKDMDMKEESTFNLPICSLDGGYGLDSYYRYERGCDRSIVEELYGVENYGIYINAISGYAQGEEMKKFRSNQTTAAIIVFLVVLFGSVTLLFLISKAMGKVINEKVKGGSYGKYKRDNIGRSTIRVFIAIYYGTESANTYRDKSAQHHEHSSYGRRTSYEGSGCKS